MEKQHFEILLEEMRGQFGLVLECHTALDRKIDRVHEQLTERLDLTDFKIQVLSDKMDAVAADLKVTDAKVDRVETNLSGHIKRVETSLNAHRTDTESHHGLYRVKEG